MAAMRIEKGEADLITPGEKLGNATVLIPGKGAYLFPNGGTINDSHTGLRVLTPPPPNSYHQRSIVDVVGHRSHGPVPEPGSIVMVQVTKVMIRMASADIMCVGSKAVKEKFTGIILIMLFPCLLFPSFFLNWMDRQRREEEIKNRSSKKGLLDTVQGKGHVRATCYKVFKQLAVGDRLPLSKLHIATLMVHSAVNKQYLSPYKEPPTIETVERKIKLGYTKKQEQRHFHGVITLEDKLSGSTFKVLTDYHSATVKLLALLAASTGDKKEIYC